MLMKKIKRIVGALICTVMMASSHTASADRLVILHTNDTHSNIDADAAGLGGVLPRKAIIDSVRRAEKNVMLVDAGDMVQGTLYFNYFKGDVEYPLFDMMGYDVRILGNHEFDNGLEELARHWRNAQGARLSANYDFTNTPAKGVFKPYAIKKIGGKKIGFLGINIDPAGMISAENYAGMRYEDAVESANRWAGYLKKKEKCDLVVAVTHIGYTTDVDKATDVDLARESRDIDIIIGGHSHTTVSPDTPEKTPSRIPNKDGKPVLVAQTGRYGRNLGYIAIDLDDLKKRDYDYRLIPVTDRFNPSEYDGRITDFLAPFKAKVDSVNNHVIGYSAQSMTNVRNGAYANWAADFGLRFGRMVADSLRLNDPAFPQADMAIMNVGGIRQAMKEGAVTEGQMLATFPFSNYMQLVRVKGKDLVETMRAAAAKGGEAISGNVRVVTDDAGELVRVVIDGKEMDPEADYVVSTIDYIANGNDGLSPMARHELLWSDNVKMNVRVLEDMARTASLGLPIQADPNPRFVKEIK